MDLRYLVGVLNSRIVNFYYNGVFGGNKLQGAYLRVGPPQIRTVPVVVPECEMDKARHDGLVELVEGMLELHKRLSEVRTEHDKEVLRRQIAATDDEIDRLVYELYGLTEEEIKIVEGDR